MSFGAGPFYFQTMRKITNTMGALLNGLDIVKANTANTAQTVAGKVTVPVEYGGKEDWFVRLNADPTANIGVQAQLPIITYELKGIHYDPTRKLSGYIKNTLAVEGFSANRYAPGFPYNMQFEVTIWTRNIDDSFQIMEQILPFFDPNYVVALKYIGAGGQFVIDEVPFILESVQPDISYEQQAAAGTSRMVVWTLEFTAKVLFFGPVPVGGLIQEVIINFRNLNLPTDNANNLIATQNVYGHNVLNTQVITMYGNGSGFYSNNEPVKGLTSGVVANNIVWSTGSNVLIASNTTGTFLANEHIVGQYTHANFVSNTVVAQTVNVIYNTFSTVEYA